MRCGSSSGRSTKSAMTRPSARPSAVSTDSVSRCFIDSLTWSRSTTTSMVCFFCLASLGGSSARLCGLPSTSARLKPCACSWRNSSPYSPLRPRMTGASTWKRESGSQREDAVDDLLRRLLGDRLAALGAVRPAGAGVEQAQVVVDLGDGADRRPRVARRGLLVDRDRRRQALDEVDVGLVHLAEELARIRRQRLDVAPLALGEDRVERQRGLARPGEPGEDDERVAREVDRDVLEVVLAGAANDEAVGH